MDIYVPLRSITETVHRRMCPLYSIGDNDEPFVVGSSVPFRCRGLSFLITAAHVCKGKDGALPLFTWGTSGPRLLKGLRLAWEHVARRPDLDIALIDLSDEDVSDLEKEYFFSSPEATARTKPKTPGVHYLIAGYPAVRNPYDVRRNTLPSLATHVITGNIVSISDVRLPEKTDEHHFAIGFKGEKISTLNGQHFRIPSPPHGMSGGGVWRLDIDTQTNVVTTPLLVGIGIEFHHSKRLFVASRIENAVPLAHDLVSLRQGKLPQDVIAPEQEASTGDNFVPATASEAELRAKKRML